jgi:hypothetical protein
MDAKALAAWLGARLTGDAAREEWTRAVAAAGEQVLATPLEVLVPRDHLGRWQEAYLSPERIRELVRPALRLGLREALVEARADRAPVGRFVSPAARARLEALAARRGLVREEWVRELFAQKAMEALVADTLYATLRDFSTLVPRIVQSAMPASSGTLGMLGKVASGVGARVFEEVERRLQGEIRRYLEAGTRRALDGAARFAIDHLDDPVAVESRRKVVAFALEQTGAFHAHALPEDLVAEVEALADALADHAATREETLAIARRVTDRVMDAHGPRPLSAFLEHLGLASPPYALWATLTWPAVEAALAAPGVQAWLEALSGELLALLAPPT